jgi:hypothetical protein
VKTRRTLKFLAIALYWALAVALGSLAFLVTYITGPCGWAPGEWCDLEGPGWKAQTLYAVGPVGVMAIAVAVYFALRFVTRKLQRINNVH